MAGTRTSSLGADPARIERERQRVGSGVHTNNVWQADIVGELALESLGFGAENIPPTGKDAANGLLDLGPARLDLRPGAACGMLNIGRYAICPVVMMRASYSTIGADLSPRRVPFRMSTLGPDLVDCP